MVLEHDHSDLIGRRFAQVRLEVTFGRHVERDVFDSAAIASRVADLRDAFADPDVRGMWTVIGGFNSNELLPHLDGELIARNPKIFCGYFDITALQNAILARTGLVTSSGPHWSTFGMRAHFDHLPDAAELTGLIIGRVQRASRMDRHILEEIVGRQPALINIPVLANVDVGHTNPFATRPIGDHIELHSTSTTHVTITRLGR
ncbi:hypothetical protein GCM10009616_37820 [Microlunatus lacustris]